MPISDPNCSLPKSDAMGLRRHADVRHDLTGVWINARHSAGIMVCHPDRSIASGYAYWRTTGMDWLANDLVCLCVDLGDCVPRHAKIDHPDYPRSYSQTQRTTLNFDRGNSLTAFWIDSGDCI